MTGYIIERDGEEVGFITDELLAQRIDGERISNEASDPAYRETYEYTVREASRRD